MMTRDFFGLALSLLACIFSIPGLVNPAGHAAMLVASAFAAVTGACGVAFHFAAAKKEQERRFALQLDAIAALWSRTRETDRPPRGPL